MTSAWILRNLWHWSLIAGAVVAAAAVCLAVLRVRAPRTRLSVLETTLAALLFISPLVSLVEQRLHGERPRLPAAPATPTLDETFATTVMEAAGAGALAWAPLLVVLWASGGALRAVWLVGGLWRLRRRVDRRPPRAIEAEAEELQTLLGTRANVEWRDDIGQPATFGAFRPRVLLPSSLASEDADHRRAVLCHELVHVRRADWPHVLIEEAARAVFWFHPAVHWLIAELRLVREQVVDRDVVERLGDRAAYLNVLYAYATRESAAPGLSPFFGRRQLERRVKSLLSEVSMSRMHRFVAILSVLCAVGAAGGATGYWYPLDLIASSANVASQETAGVVGPVEARANALEHGAPTPRRTHVTPFKFPASARGVLASAVVTVRLVVDDAGAVAEARVVRVREEWRPGANAETMEAATRLVSEDALRTVRQWRYDPPASPVFWTMTVFYNDGPRQADRERADAPAPEPSGRVLRVGGAVKPPQKLVNVAPEYPQAARDAGITGVVAIEATIDETGSVSDAKVVKSSPEFDEAALEAVRQWKYQPTLLNGAPVPVIMTVTLNFALPE